MTLSSLFGVVMTLKIDQLDCVHKCIENSNNMELLNFLCNSCLTQNTIFLSNISRDKNQVLPREHGLLIECFVIFACAAHVQLIIKPFSNCHKLIHSQVMDCHSLNNYFLTSKHSARPHTFCYVIFWGYCDLSFRDLSMISELFKLIILYYEQQYKIHCTLLPEPGTI